MTQNELFIESLSDALDEVIKQLGGVKNVGSMLWPEKTIREAGSQLLNCLNPEHAQKLSLEQIEFIFTEARKRNIHTIAKWYGDKYSYKVDPIDPQDVKNELQREFIDTVNRLDEIKKSLEKVSATEPQLRRVSA